MLRRSTGLLAVVVLGVAMLGLSACNTVSGAGKDLSAAGHDVTGTSSAAQDKIHDKTGAANN